MAHADGQLTEDNDIWFLDSGCSNHMTGNKNWFVELDESFTLFVWETILQFQYLEKEASNLK